MSSPRRIFAGRLGCAELFGSCHSETAGPRTALDEHIDKSTKHALEIGAYAQAGCVTEQDVWRAKLREFYFLLGVMVKSVHPDNTQSGLDAPRAGSDHYLYPSFREMMCDLLECPNPWTTGSPKSEASLDASPESS